MFTKQFSQIAHAVTDNVADLLYAQVCVTNQQGVVIASSEPHQVGQLFSQICKQAINYLRVPFSLNSHRGEVIVWEPLNGEVISPRLAKVLVELVVNQTTTLNSSPNQSELKHQFIDDLLHEKILDEGEIIRHAKLLGLSLTPPRAVILIDAADYILQSDKEQTEINKVDQRRKAQVLIGSVVSFFHLPDDTICSDLGGGEIAVLKASNNKNLGNWVEQEEIADPFNSSWTNLTALKRAGDALLMRLRYDTGAAISIGIGRYHPGVLGLARSYQDARMALSLGRQIKGKNQVYGLDRLGIAAFVGLADERTKIELATHLLSPLDNDAELLLTIEEFFNQNCCYSATAKRLSIHRNTLNYRLDKLRSLIGLDPRQFDDAVQVRLALLLRKLHLGKQHEFCS